MSSFDKEKYQKLLDEFNTCFAENFDDVSDADLEEAAYTGNAISNFILIDKSDLMLPRPEILYKAPAVIEFRKRCQAFGTPVASFEYEDGSLAQGVIGTKLNIKLKAPM